MKRRKIDPETKTAAFLEGLKGESSVADICRKYQISESLYYRWRDKFLEAGSRALAFRNGSGPEAAGRGQDCRTGTHYWQTGG
jgi:transposase